MSALLAVLGAGVAAGIMVAILGIRGVDRDRAPFRRRRSVLDRMRRWPLGRVALAAAAGSVVWLLTGWPVAGLALAGLLGFLPWLFDAARVAKVSIDRLKALEEWTRRLADLMTSGQFGLQRAIQASAATAPAAIATQVATLAQRLRRWDVEAAFLAFADELDDQIGDAVSAGLIVAHRQGSGVGAVLRALATHISVEVGARRRVEAERARPRSTARLLTIMSLALFVGLTMVGRGSYMTAYGTLVGQLVLTVVVGLLALALVWMRRMSIGAPSPRFLVGRRS